MSTPEPTKTVLIVEDNDIEREGMATVLKRAGYSVSTAQSADLALTSSDAMRPPNVILLDMMMSGTDGWRFLELRKKKPALASVPVVIVTGLDVASAEWAKSLGARTVLKKPFDSPDLLQEVQRCFAGSQRLSNG